MVILLLETIDQMGMAFLEDVGTVIQSPTPNAHDHDLPFGEITAIVTRGLGQLDANLILKCPNLKVIARCGAGLNNVDVDAAKKARIPVIHAPGINATAVAEQSLMLMLCAVRRGFVSANEVKNNNWQSRDSFCGDDMSGKNICLIGTGNIGQKTASLCRAFSNNVSLCSRDGRGHTGLLAALSQRLPVSDIVSLHIPISPATTYLFDYKMLSIMKPGAVLINTARGALVDESALLSHLDTGHISAYAADVMDAEPPAENNELIAHPHSIITPHVAALSKSTYREMCVFTAKNVAAVLSNGIPEPVSIFAGAR